MAVNFCPKCGGKLAENAKFCAKCGSPVPQVSAVSPAPAAVVEPEPIVPVQPEPVAVEPEPIVPVQPEPVAVEPEPIVPVQPEPVAVEPEPIVPVQPEPVAVEPESIVPVHLEPVAVEPEPVAAVKPKPAAPVRPAAPAQAKAAPARTAAPVAVKEPAPRPQKSEKPVKKYALPRRGAGRTVLAVLLCFLIFIWSIVTIVLTEVRLATSGSNLASSISGAMEEIDLKEVSASTLIAGETDPDKTLADWVVEQIEDNYDGEVKVSDEDLDTFMEQSTIGPFLSEKLGAYADDLYTGNGQSGFTAKELEDLLEENVPLMEEVFDLQLTDADIEKIVATAEESGTLDYFSTEVLKQEAAPVYYAVHIGLSWWVIGFAACQVLLFVLLLAVVNKQALRTCGDVGITLTVAGGILALGGLACKILPVFIPELSILSPVAGILLYRGNLPALVALGLGVVLILVMVIGRVIRAKVAAKKSAK